MWRTIDIYFKNNTKARKWFSVQNLEILVLNRVVHIVSIVL